MSESAPWIKLWWDWYASRSHLGLSGVALALGPPLMLLARAHAKRHESRHCDAESDEHSQDEDETVWLRDKSGKPISLAAVAQTARFSTKQTESGLAELVDAGTLVVGQDGSFGFPNFWRYQETVSAGRMRRHRERNRSRHSDGPGDDQRTEDRGQRIEREEEGGTLAAPAAANSNASEVSDLLPHEPSPEPKKRKTDERKLLFRALLKSESATVRLVATPDVSAKVADAVIRMAAETAQNTGRSFPDCLRERIAGGLAEHRRSGKPAQWAIKDFVPRAVLPPAGQRRGLNTPEDV